MTYYSDIKKFLENKKDSNSCSNDELIQNLKGLFPPTNPIEEPLRYLYSDIIEKECDFDFMKVLDDEHYEKAKDSAEECIDICKKCRVQSEIKPVKIKNWTLQALHCFIILLYHLIYNILKDGPKNHHNKSGYNETDLYFFLKDKKERRYKQIGTNFYEIHKRRNMFAHSISGNDKPRVSYLSLKELRNIHSSNIKYFKESLIILLEIFKEHYSEVN